MFTPALPQPQLFAAVICITLLSGALACTPQDESAVSHMSRQKTPRIAELDNESAVVDSERVAGSVTVTAARPAAGDGVVQVFRRAPLRMPGATSAYAMDGVAGPLQHGFLVVLDAAGAVKLVTHKWSNADNSVVAQTDCGSHGKCPPAQVTADPRTGAVTFNGLVLTGLDGNTGDPATSTLTGRVP